MIFLYLCKRLEFSKTGNFFQSRKQKVVQNGKLFLA